MFDHVGVEVLDLEKSKRFYTQTLAPLGSTLVKDLKEWGAAGFGVDRPQFWIGQGNPKSSEDAVHVCFAAKNRAEQPGVCLDVSST